MQSYMHHECKGNKLNSLEELLAAFKLMQAAKPLARSQSELAMAAVLNASKVVGGRLPQSAAPVHKHPKGRASSLPIGIPSYAPATPPTIARSPVQDVPLYQSRVNGTLTKPNVQIASPQSDRPPIKTCLYKTEMCRGWEATGRCSYGSKCQFAHGVQELQPVQRHPKYKTEICRTFAQTRSCRYGKRCRFIHPDSSTDLSLLLNAQTDHHMHTLYQSPALSKEPCSQDCCSSTAPPPTPDSLGYASPQAIPQYSGVHPATYQLEDDFLHPVPVTPQAACFDSSQAACFDSPPYTTPYSSSAVPVSSDATCFDASPYTSPEPSLSGSVLDAQGCSLMACLPAPGDVDAISSGLLGCGYSAQESAGLMLGGTGHGGQLKSSPRGVLEYAARQGYGHSCGEQGLHYSQINAIDAPKPFGSSLYGTFTTYA